MSNVYLTHYLSTSDDIWPIHILLVRLYCNGKGRTSGRHSSETALLLLFVCLLKDASGHSNVLKAGKAEELKTLGKGVLPEKPTS